MSGCDDSLLLSVATEVSSSFMCREQADSQGSSVQHRLLLRQLHAAAHDQSHGGGGSVALPGQGREAVDPPGAGRGGHRDHGVDSLSHWFLRLRGSR